MSEYDRQLMQNAMTGNNRPLNYEFMSAPPELQDEIVEALDNRKMTFAEAARACREKGFLISYESLRRYHSALRMQRKSEETSNALLVMLKKLEEAPIEDSIRGFVNLLVTIVAAGLLEGKIKVKEIDVAKVLTCIPEGIVKGLETLGQLQKNAPIDVSPEAKKRLKDLYGVQ